MKLVSLEQIGEWQGTTRWMGSCTSLTTLLHSFLHSCPSGPGHSLFFLSTPPDLIKLWLLCLFLLMSETDDGRLASSA